jgi:hypothetical protein
MLWMSNAIIHRPRMLDDPDPGFLDHQARLREKVLLDYQ